MKKATITAGALIAAVCITLSLQSCNNTTKDASTTDSVITTSDSTMTTTEDTMIVDSPKTESRSRMVSPSDSEGRAGQPLPPKRIQTK